MNPHAPAVNTLGTARPMPSLALAGVAAALVLHARPAHADLLAAYVGGAIGQARVEAGDRTVATSVGSVSTGSFAENHSAFKVIAGVRMLSFVGAEIEYLDFGHPQTALASSVLTRSSVKMNGVAAYGMLYLRPVPLLDLYLKAGLARLEASSTVNGFIPGVVPCQSNPANCATFSQHFSATNTSAAAGAGVQVKIRKWSVHAEYERFNAAGGNPGLASVGVRWNFL